MFKLRIKIPEEELSKVEVINLPNTEVKAVIIKMFNKVRRRMNEHGGKFNKELET